ncbi:MAG: hypothetical protein ACRBCI_00820 [Cellvibrionaceae bacterium]
MKKVIVSFIVIGIGAVTHAETVKHTSYAGQQHRTIKSFSAEDIQALKSGTGWGLAKPAELNGIPGPIHLLELQKELNLSQQQIDQIQAIWADMNQQAKQYGHDYLAAEEKLDHFFQSQQNNPAILKQLLDQSAAHLAELRHIHLMAHLKARPLLSSEQVKQYSNLRGYNKTNVNHSDHQH